MKIKINICLNYRILTTISPFKWYWSISWNYNRYTYKKRVWIHCYCVYDNRRQTNYNLLWGKVTLIQSFYTKNYREELIYNLGASEMQFQVERYKVYFATYLSLFNHSFTMTSLFGRIILLYRLKRVVSTKRDLNVFS